MRTAGLLKRDKDAVLVLFSDSVAVLCGNALDGARDDRSAERLPALRLIAYSEVRRSTEQYDACACVRDCHSSTAGLCLVVLAAEPRSQQHSIIKNSRLLCQCQATAVATGLAGICFTVKSKLR